MNARGSKIIALALLTAFLTITIFLSAATCGTLGEDVRKDIFNKFQSLQIPFLENSGQIRDGEVLFYAKTLGAGFFITEDGQIVYSLSRTEDRAMGWIIKESFAGASTSVVKGEEKTTINVTEFKGKDPFEWKSNIPSYSQVSLGEVGNGIELTVKAYGGGLEKSFNVKPMGAIEGLRIKIEGAESLAVRGQGELEVGTGLGVIKFSRPIAYQRENGAYNYVDVAYVVNGDEYGLITGEYDRTKELVIAPIFVSTFIDDLYDSVDESSLPLAIDTDGNIYLAGSTPTANYPISGVRDTTRVDSTDVFVARISGDLTNMLAIAFLGGSQWEEAYAIAIDNQGKVCVGGGTTSEDFPTTLGVFDTDYKGLEDAFIAKLDEDLQTLISSSYLGGTGDDRITSLRIDNGGNIIIQGVTTSSDVAALFSASGISSGDTSIPFNTTFDNKLNSLLPKLADSSLQEPPTSQSQAQKSQTDRSGQIAGPGWFSGKADPISHEEAQHYYDTKQKEGGLQIVALAADIQSNEIIELARSLRNDPKLIYDYVHNHIDYVPYFGSLKGATLTYLDGSGNDFDQASLMIALLRASGYTVQYVYGTMTIPGAQLANWVGVDQMWQTIGAVFPSGGIPTSNLQTNGTATIDRVWVKATINSVDYLFDPAFKSYTYTGEINNIGQAMGYSQSGLLTAAGGTIGNNGYSIQNLNETNIRNQLSTYASNLVNIIRSQYPNYDVNQIIGGRSIIQTNLTEYQTSLPYSPVTTYTWSDIPAQYTTTLRIQHVGIDYTFTIHDLSGKRVTLTYAGTNHHPELRQDGSLLASGNATTTGSKYDLTVTIDHPYAAPGPDGPGTYADVTPQHPVVYSLTSRQAYAIVYNFGGVSDLLLQKRQQQLETYRAQGLADTSEAVRGETLNVMGQTWLKEVSMSNRLLSTLAKTASATHHMVGLMAQESGYYIDVKAAFSSIVSKQNIASDALAHFKTYGLIGSAFEHGMLEQLMGSDKPGVSTMKLFQRANETGRIVFYANASNYSTIRPQLEQTQTYTADELDDFQNRVNNGYTLILPDNGQLQLAVGQWKGKGYISKKFSEGTASMEMAIGRNYLGGYVSFDNISVDDTLVYRVTSTGTANDLRYWAPNREISLSIEPVDMGSGAYFYERTDLALGGGAPLGLAFVRSYDSGLNLSKRTLGYGWSHNYDIYLTPISHGDPGLGRRQPVDAAAMIAALHVMLDLMRTQDTIQAWMVTSLISKWAVDQVIDNAITVHLGNKVMEYVKLADGTYAPPPGMTTQLTQNGDTYSLQERFGTRLDFNAERNITQLVDIDSNTMTFLYDSANPPKLKTVQDAFGRTLELNYNSKKNIKKVTDSASPKRSVSYDYDADENLTSFTDAETKTWEYGYDPDVSSHRMTTLKNPLTPQITTATNEYDNLGRVKKQTVPRQSGANATYNFYFSGFRNVEEDPAGNTITYYYDAKGREIAQENALGHKLTKEFDGQDHTIKITDPRQKITTFFYDGNHNLTKIKNALNYETTNKYDSQFRLTDVIDPLYHGTSFGYDSEHHPTQSKYGVQYHTETLLPLDNGLSQTGASYYPNGLINTSTDGRGTVTAMVPDAYGNPDTTQTGSHPVINFTYDAIGRMTDLTDQVASNTHFIYDKRNLMTSRTDPLTRNTTLVYDDAGRLHTRTDRNTNMTTYTYTPTDKVDTITYPGASTVHFIYNQHDQLETMQDSLGTTGYRYDPVGRLTSVTDPHGFVVSYPLYDEAGNLKEITYPGPGNKKVSYTYNELNRLKTVTINWLSQTATYNYDLAGRLTRINNFNGTITDITGTNDYDNANRLKSFANKKSGGTTISSYQFSLDGNGNRIQVVQNEPLIPALGTGTTDYTYNPKKNRLLSAVSAGTDSFTYDYDNEGQLSTGYGSSYTFDYEHRLVGIGSSDQFSYNGRGNRLKAVRGGVITKYIYDASGNLLAEADGSNNILRYYVYGLGLLAMVTSSNQVYCYHFNATGSTIAMTDQSQTMVNKYAYDPFGDGLNAVENVPQPFKFVGQFGVMSEPNGFYYMRARYYDPEVGRFISEDPIGFDGGDVNMYAYVRNNPVNFNDPNGELAFYWHFGITYVAARNSGYGVWNSLKLASNAMMPDFRRGANSTDWTRTREHGMGGYVNGEPQTYGEGIASINNYIQNARLGDAIHAGQDLVTPGHSGNLWEGHLTLGHALGDAYPSLSTIKQAYEITKQISSGNVGSGYGGGGSK